MENSIFLSQKELMQEAKNCLDEYENAIDSLVDTGRVDYQTARISTLVKHMHIDRTQAKGLLEQLDNASRESMRQMQQVKKAVDEIQKDQYDILVDQLTFEYEVFCKKNNIDTRAPLSEDLKQTTIFEFPEIGGAKQQVPLWLAHFLLKPNAKMDCREFFVSATRGRMF